MTLNYSRTLLTCQVVFLILPVITINEVAWMGTVDSYSNEWIELYNNTDSPANLDGWVLKATDGTPKINLAGSIPANDFYLLERSKDYTGALNNQGEKLELYDNSGNLIDSVDCLMGWPVGDNTTKQTMERKGVDAWQTSQSVGGTPKAQNSKATENSSPRTEEVSVKLGLTETKPNPVEEKVKKEIAAVDEQATGPTSLFIFLIAAALAVFSGIIILVLKKGVK